MRHGPLIVALTALVLGGCASAPPASGAGGRIAVEAGRYEEAFAIARDELARLGFRTERVDAYAGVISTEPRPSGGLATPWDREQTSLKSEAADLFHPQRRTVRIAFVPAERADALPSDEPVTQITGEGMPEPMTSLSANTPLVARVEVLIEREYRPHLRVSSVSVESSRRTEDPQLAPRAMNRSFQVVTQRDHALESALARRIAERLLRQRAGGSDGI